MVGYTGGFRACFDIVDVALDRCFAAIFYGRGADNRSERHDGPAHHRGFEILGIVFRKCGDLLLEHGHFFRRACFESFQALLDVGEEAWLGKLAIRNDVDAADHLSGYALDHGLPECLVKRRRVDRLAGIFAFHGVEEGVRPGQAANMGRLNPAGVLLNGHENPFSSQTSWLPATLRRISGRQDC